MGQIPVTPDLYSGSIPVGFLRDLRDRVDGD